MQNANLTMKKIAKELGVSVSTVSRALQNHPRIGSLTREKVQKLAKELHYQPNSRAINFKNNKSFNVGVVLPYLTEQYFSIALTGIEQTLMSKGYSMVVMQSMNDYERESAAIESLIKHGVDGILVSMASETYNKTHFNNATHKVPIVFFDRVLKHPRYSAVYGNITKAAFDAMEYLIGKGFTEIALMNGPNSLQSTEERLKGYIDGLKKYNIPVSASYIKNLNLTKEDTILKINELLDLENPPKVVLAFHDYIALDAMQICKERGLQINRDISFVTFSNLSFCSYLDNPPIATVEQFPAELGAQAAGLLLEAMETPDTYQPREIVVEPKLIIR
ncbi:LacI family DNA-binding transcriptional regulator [Dyadobacter psychrotolerans]|uniref:LacI family transcriptional regulator n=1 Tax=Dyadobacter psychrotolerans TaxID=2541721 RepID=A0A4R5DFY2_9BACT|nr:LacI family DNA-binding transcriptional regulator [Dyadobacter psychrotolerans]TDE12892.1 LacI family transcriptional regulator [Dyadobacter psychrotolerans]